MNAPFDETSKDGNDEVEVKDKAEHEKYAKMGYVHDKPKMESPEEIIYHFWRVRNDYYIKRQEKLVKKISGELDVITTKINFVNDVIDEKIKYQWRLFAFR